MKELAASILITLKLVCLMMSAIGGCRHVNTRSPQVFLNSPLSLLDVELGVAQSPVGSHLISPRKFFMHHGIHLGGGLVAHYTGYSGSITPGPIEVTDIESFANGRPVWILKESCKYSSDEIVRRARSRLGERHYRILSNNCEHFCSWCTRGKSHSAQVETLLHSPQHFFSIFSAFERGFIA